jgi:hypothetical protein
MSGGGFLQAAELMMEGGRATRPASQLTNNDAGSK